MKDSVTLIIPIRSEEQRNKIFEAEKKLSEAGITFDTGFDMIKNERHWELDWSLSGAEIKVATDTVREFGAKIPSRLTKDIFGREGMKFVDATLSPKVGAKRLLDQVIGRR